MTDESDRERIVRLETEREHQKGFNQEVIQRLDSIDGKVGVISQWVQNKSGFMAGVLFCLGIIAAALGAMSDHLWKFITGHQ